MLLAVLAVSLAGRVHAALEEAGVEIDVIKSDDERFAEVQACDPYIMCPDRIAPLGRDPSAVGGDAIDDERVSVFFASNNRMSGACDGADRAVARYRVLKVYVWSGLRPFETA